MHKNGIPSEKIDNSLMRLQKFLAHCGLCSRRKAEELIWGRGVTINGRIASVGDCVNPTKDIIEINGEQIGQRRILTNVKVPTVFMLNKPRGYVCSHYDVFNEKTIFDLIPKYFHRNRLLFCGRLDKNTTGLMILSDSGEFVQKISHPSAGIKKYYEVVISKPLSSDVKLKFLEGVRDDRQLLKFDKIFSIGKGDLKDRTFKIILSQGKKNEIRRIFEHFGYFVQKLHRNRIGNLRLNGIGIGKFKRLSEKEIKLLFE
jgi:23S rRNA pseudouridine2605 synthase